MKNLEKLIENVTKIIEEEYDKVMLDKSEDMKDYKEMIKLLLKQIIGYLVIYIYV